MLQVDLSTLSSPELKRLLNVTRERGQASLTYQVLQEMADRRERGPAGFFASRRPAEPRVIAVELDDPLEPPEMEPAAEDDIPPLPPGWVPHAAAPAIAAAEPGPSPRRRQKKTPAAARLEPEPQPAPEPAPQPDIPAAAFAPTPTARPPRFSRWSGLLFAAGVSLGVACGWWAGGVTRDLLRQDSAPKLATSAPAPSVAPVAASVQTASAAPVPATAPTEAPESDAVSVADVQPASPPSPTAVNEPEPNAAPPCAAAPTPADRTICAHPHLQALQRDLRRAYAEALIVHQDRALLRQRQLAWRDARNDVAAPDRLARLYDDRIRKLHAAAADARRRAKRA